MCHRFLSDDYRNEVIKTSVMFDNSRWLMILLERFGLKDGFMLSIWKIFSIKEISDFREKQSEQQNQNKVYADNKLGCMAIFLPQSVTIYMQPRDICTVNFWFNLTRP